MTPELGGVPDRKLTRPLRKRLPHYYRLAERQQRSAAATQVPLEELAEAMGIGIDEVKEDMHLLGLDVQEGRVSAGSLKDVSEHLLGLRPVNTAILVGMGRLGSAIASYEGFGPYGMRIVAVFDDDPQKIDRFVSGLRILPTEQIEDVVSIFQIRLAVLTVPPEVAQETADRLVHCGIQAIWNFAPVRLQVPDDVVVRDEHIAKGLAQLCNDIREMNLRKLPPEEE